MKKENELYLSFCDAVASFFGWKPTRQDNDNGFNIIRIDFATPKVARRPNYAPLSAFPTPGSAAFVKHTNEAKRLWAEFDAEQNTRVLARYRAQLNGAVAMPKYRFG